jgi:hypothetical protein
MLKKIFLEISEEATASSCLMLVTPMRMTVSLNNYLRPERQLDHIGRADQIFIADESG